MITLACTDTPRVWIGCLACYNAGRLTGRWYDADIAELVDGEDIHGCSTAHDELWVMDYENFLGLIEGECSPAYAAKVADILKEVAPHERAPFAAWYSEYGGEEDDLAASVERFRDEYQGEHDSEGEFARERAEERLTPEERQLLTHWPFNAIDWDCASVELFTGGHTSFEAPGGGVYVFNIG
ncbi:antirestriction protein ArdA [Streptomyces sp. NPDC045456]|uniref:antirestriction protein ArdA n=1 Tax=Streptomyces sp. NPDC045456 TaxID=3155254 RepID=UPI003410A2B2